MLFRPSMAIDLEKAGCFKNSSLIYSLWPGYLKEEKFNWFHDWLNKNKIPLKHCHTSGHTPIFDLQRFANAIKADRLVPIHSFEPNFYVLKRKEEAAFGEFMSKRKCLEEYDRIKTVLAESTKE